MTTHLSNNNGVLVDTRTLEEGGKLMHIVLHLQMTDGRQVFINRYFVKSNLTCEELLEQNDAVPTKRYASSLWFKLFFLHDFHIVLYVVHARKSLIQTKAVHSTILSISYLLVIYIHWI